MIRINLLKNRREPVDGLEAAIAADGPSAFINRREIVLGVLFLGLGAGILLFSAISNRAGGGDLTPQSSARMDLSAGLKQESAASVAISATVASAVDVLPEGQSDRPAASAAEPVKAPPVGGEAPAQLRSEEAAVPPAAAVISRESAAAPAAAKAASPRGQVTPALPPPTLPRPSSPPAVVPSQLSALVVSTRGGTIEILATIGGQPAYQMFRLNSPNRVVVDLSGVTLALPASQRQLTPSHSLVERVRIAQFQVSPPKVRMVFDVSEFPEIAVNRSPDGLTLKVAAPAP